MQLTGNTILITGGGTGIGLALAEEFLKRDNRVIVCGRRATKLEEAKEKLPELETFVCDISKQEERQGLAEHIGKEFPKLNMLINNAGIQQEVNLADADEIDRIQQEVETNFIAPIHLSALLTPLLSNNKLSAIINISSGLAFTPLAIMPVYCATKAALHSYTLSLRYQLSRKGIKVYEIAPPIVDTDLDKGARDKRGQTDKGMSPAEFAEQAIEALKNDTLEAAVGSANFLRMKREEAFANMNH